MKLQNLDVGCGVIVFDASFRALCDSISEIHGVVFTKRDRWFWLGSNDERAEFVLDGQMFLITCDDEGDYWVQPKDPLIDPGKIKVVREHLAKRNSG